MVRTDSRRLVAASVAVVGASLLAVWWLAGTVIPLQLSEQIHCPDLFGPPAECDSASLLLLLPIAAALAAADLVPLTAGIAAVLIGAGALAVTRFRRLGTVLVLLPAGVVGVAAIATALLALLTLVG